MRDEGSKESPFGRQGLPVKVTITGGEQVDRYDMLTKIYRSIHNSTGAADFSFTKDNIEFYYYPRAVND